MEHASPSPQAIPEAWCRRLNTVTGNVQTYRLFFSFFALNHHPNPAYPKNIYMQLNIHLK
jgi:hypothetical protein